VLQRWDIMASSKIWQSHIPLHAHQLLVPNLLSSAQDYGAALQNGVMVCGLSWSPPSPLSMPSKLRKHWPPPPLWRKPETLPFRLRSRLCEVAPYSSAELQHCLEFYAHIGHLRSRRLESKLVSGELRRQVALITGRVPADVFRVCEAMP